MDTNYSPDELRPFSNQLPAYTAYAYKLLHLRSKAPSVRAMTKALRERVGLRRLRLRAQLELQNVYDHVAFGLALPRIALFQRKQVRRTIHNNEWWFVIADVVAALTDSTNPSDYLKKMRKRDPFLGDAFKGGGQIIPPLPCHSRLPAVSSASNAGTPKASSASSTSAQAMSLLCRVVVFMAVVAFIAFTRADFSVC